MRTCSRAMLTFLIVSGLAAGCGGPRNERISRHDPEMVVDINIDFNDTDARDLSGQFADDCLSAPWLSQWDSAHPDRRPIVALAAVKNNTRDYDASSIFPHWVKESLLESGRVRVMAEREIREALRAEKRETELTEPSMIKRMKAELGVDYVISGELFDDFQQSTDRRTRSVTYIARMELHDTESLETVWIGSAETKKIGVR